MPYRPLSNTIRPIPIVHGIEGVNALKFVEVIRSCIVGVHVIRILHLSYPMCDKIAYKIVFSVVRVLPLCSFVKNGFFLFFGNLRFGHIIET